MNRARTLTLAVTLLGTLAAGCSGGGTLAPVAAPTTAPATSAPATQAPATAAAAGTTSSAASATASSPADPANCATSELTGSLGPAEGAAGSVDQTLILTNVGTRTCALRGFPGVSYVAGDDGHQVGPAAAMSGERGSGVDIAPGKSVGAELKLVQVANYDAAVCRPVPVRGLRVYPPGDTASLFVAREGTGCSAATLPGDQISVRAVQAT